MPEEIKRTIIDVVEKSGNVDEVAEHVYNVCTAVWDNGYDSGLKKGLLCGIAIAGGSYLATALYKYYKTVKNVEKDSE